VVSIRWVEIETYLKEKNLSEKMKFWKKTIENVKDFSGTSPPSVFVGSSFYPKVFLGILSPPIKQENAWMLDSPEQWYESKASIDDVIAYRSEMIYSRFLSNVKSAGGKLVDVLQELAMSKRQVDVDVELKKKPTFRFNLDRNSTPIGNPAPLIHAKIVDNPVVERKVDYIISDVDLDATNAVLKLYKNVPVSRIQKIFSAGLMGLKFQRKFVPTRWSITAVDDIISKNLLKKVRVYPELNEFRLFYNEYLGNHYQILLIPAAYQYELVEMWHLEGRVTCSEDYEPYWGRKDYAETTAGAFYSGRLAAMEYLEKIKRQAAVLIIREVTKDYYLPLGIWQLREAVRDAFNKPFERFPDLQSAVKKINERAINIWMNKSKLLKNLKEQTKLDVFARKSK
jgi:hypothetical protein